MRKYEIMTILKSDLGEEGAKKLSKSIQEAITKLDGTIDSAKFLGKRKFAYKIKHDTQGFYDQINFQMDPVSVQKFRKTLNLTQGVVRYLISTQDRKDK